MTTRTDQGRDFEAWIFVDGTTTPPSSNEASLSRLLNKLGFGDIKSSSQIPTDRETKELGTQSTKKGPSPALGNGRKVSNTEPDNKLDKKKGKYLSKPPTSDQDSDLLEDENMVNMVNELVGPSDDVRPRSGQAQAEPSYGMHSSTANEIFGNKDTSPIQPSPVSKAIPYLPWDLVYKPTPHRTNSQDRNQLSPNGYNVPRSASGQLNGLTSSSYLDDLGASYNQTHPNTLSPRLNTGYVQASPIPSASSPSLPRKGYGLDTLEDSRCAVLDSLKSALLAQHGLAPKSPSPGSHMQDLTSTTPVWGQGNGMAESRFPQAGGSILERSSSHLINKENLQNPLGPPGQGRPELGQAALTTGAGRFAISTKSTSNNFDAQHIWGQGQGSSRYHQPRSPWQNEPSIASSMAFSHPSSLITGTPDPVSAAPANSVACNGHYYNATTPFGRLGDGVNNRADPTHFRNQLKAVTGTSELPYDQQILQAAMMDNDRKPRPK
ncbi:hypothetical protein CIB48_g9843 [Xylaria polymorpha]|nr:hypothetical protein CIB48_g9843 [Xylaria polymorpha]